MTTQAFPQTEKLNSWLEQWQQRMSRWWQSVVTDVQQGRQARYMSGKFELYFIVYNAFVALVFSSLLIFLVTHKVFYATSNESSPALEVLLPTLLTLFVAGGVGGILCNLRGIFRYYRDESKFPSKFAVPFVIRPGMGAMVGMLTFFLATLMNAALADAASLTWASFPDRLAYVALAVVAGFGSQEFLERLKEIARTTFSEQATPPVPLQTTLVATWSETKGVVTGPAMPLPIEGNTLILMYGALQDKGTFEWCIFEPGKILCAPSGSAEALKISGGEEAQRWLLAEELAKQIARTHGKTASQIQPWCS